MLSGRLFRSCNSCVWNQLRTQSTGTPGRLAGKVAAVTAATNGIGLAIAQRLAEDGARVMISSRKADNVNRVVEQMRANNLSVSGVPCHVSKAADRTALIEKTVQEFGGLDILVSNAGVSPHFGDIMESSEQHWDKLLDVNVKSAFLLVKEALPHLEKSKNGSIVLVSSIGAFAPFHLIGPYCASKTALLGMMKAMVLDLGSRNVRINAIAPGVIKTPFSQQLWATPEIEEASSSQIPLGRLGVPEDCAGPVSFLVSDDAQYISGECIVIAGGSQSRL